LAVSRQIFGENATDVRKVKKKGIKTYKTTSLIFTTSAESSHFISGEQNKPFCKI
jgi:hypothetical protein